MCRTTQHGQPLDSGRVPASQVAEPACSGHGARLGWVSARLTAPAPSLLPLCSSYVAVFAAAVRNTRFRAVWRCSATIPLLLEHSSSFRAAAWTTWARSRTTTVLPAPGRKLLRSKSSRGTLPVWGAHKRRVRRAPGSTGGELSTGNLRQLCSLGGPSAHTKWVHWSLSGCVPADSVHTMLHKYEIAWRGAVAPEGAASRARTDPGSSPHA